MKSLKSFRDNIIIKKANKINSVLGGGWVTSYWAESSGGCITHVHDAFDDLNGDGQRQANESGSLCTERDCGSSGGCV
ncbi:hypothetical protein [Ascidiimonas aurantiaca]|uniref:hypothetical protein n=1 Tax=Ascidiimonas aurantiaca TaxID=1685432 RepID=UPI0030EDB89F